MCNNNNKAHNNKNNQNITTNPETEALLMQLAQTMDKEQLMKLNTPKPKTNAPTYKSIITPNATTTKNNWSIAQEHPAIGKARANLHELQ